MSHINEALAAGELRETSKGSRAFSRVWAETKKKKLWWHNMRSGSLCLNMCLSVANDI